LITAKTRLDAIEAHAKSLHPLSPLGRGFALLQDSDRIISANEFLSEFNEVAIAQLISEVLGDKLELSQFRDVADLVPIKR